LSKKTEQPNIIGQRIKAREKKSRKSENFIVFRMWWNTFFSLFRSDKGTIPFDIGSGIYLGENQYVTGQYMSTCFLVTEYTLQTPIAMCSRMIREIKSMVPDIVIDFTFKNIKFELSPNDTALKDRVEGWKSHLSDPDVPRHVKEREAWLLYSYEVLNTGKLAFQTRSIIWVRAKNNATLKRACKEVSKYLSEYGIQFKQIKNDISRYIDYSTILLSKYSAASKDIPAIISTTNSLAEILPVTQGINDEIGLFIGIDKTNNAPYFINTKATARAKNFYVLSASGEGKTFLVITWLIDGFADGYSECIMDIKGNEFTSFTKSCGGIILSMRRDSSMYINNFRIRREGLRPGDDPGAYFRDKLALNRKFLAVIANLGPEFEDKGHALFEEFLSAVYLQLGVLQDNVNTWFRTNELNPFKIYEYFQQYVSPDIRRLYGDIIEKTLMNMKIYIDPRGSNSDEFRTEYNLDEVLDTRVLTFDFGLLDSRRNVDPVMLKLKLLDMMLINDEFVRRNKEKGLSTIKVLEESQIVDDFLMDIYAEEFSLRRAQNQVTIMLGNSITALKGSKSAQIILDNLNVIIVGKTNNSTINYLNDEYRLGKHMETLERINTDIDFDRVFLVINRIQRNNSYAQIKAFVPDNVVRGQIFKIVDVEGNEDKTK